MDKVEVLMSTYNGELYISEQISSILKQEKVDIHITIRDDGSKDKTISIIKGFQVKYPNRITLYVGSNVGYRHSFLKLLELSDDNADYYAFSDQDDVWCENKCYQAVKKLRKYKNKIALYTCSPTICDKDMNPQIVNDMSSTNNTVYSFFVRSRFPGCCMTFTYEIIKIVKGLIKEGLYSCKMLDHDFLVGAIAYAYGTVIRDSNSFMMHRRLDNSVTSGGKGMIDRIKTEIKNIFSKKSVKSELIIRLVNYHHFPSFENKK